MKLPMEKFYLNLTDVGNTSSASIPLCLDKAVREGVLKDGIAEARAKYPDSKEVEYICSFIESSKRGVIR